MISWRNAIGDRVMVLHNIMLGNLIGTVTAIHYNTYEVTLDGGGKSNMFGFQLQNINELEDALASESKREAAGTADEKPDGQAENADGDGRRETAPPRQ